MLGVSSYAYGWRRNPHRATPLTLFDMLDDAVRLGVGLVQLCDLPELEAADAEWLASVRSAAESRGLALETGTKGVEVEHLRAHLGKAVALGAPLVRSMLSSPRGTPSVAEAVEQLRTVTPDFEAAGVTLALETYEQFSTRELLEVIEAVSSPALGVCLDPGNSVARLETPASVWEAVAPHVVNLHVKDFAFTRQDGLIGFRFEGAPLGEGQLDYDAMCDALDAAGRQVNHVVEHWLTRRGSVEETARLEQDWVDASVAWLRARGRV